MSGIESWSINKEGQPKGNESLSWNDIIFQSIEGIVNSPNLKKDDISNFLKSIGITFFTRTIDEIQLRMYELSKNDPNYLKKVEEKLKQFCSKKIDKIQELISNIFSSEEINSEWLKIICKYNTVYDFVNYLRRDLSLNFNELDRIEDIIKEHQNFQEELNGVKIEIRTKVDERVSFIMSNLEALQTNEERIAFLVEEMGISEDKAKEFLYQYFSIKNNEEQKENMVIDNLIKQKQEVLNKANDAHVAANGFDKDYKYKTILAKGMRTTGAALLFSGVGSLFGTAAILYADEIENQAKLDKNNYDNSIEIATQYEKQANNLDLQIEAHRNNPRSLNSSDDTNARNFINGAVILEGKDTTDVDNLIEAVCNLTYSADNIIGLKNEIKKKLQDVDINNSDNNFALFTMLDFSIKAPQDNNQTKLMSLLYSILIDGIDVESDEDVDIFIRTVQGEETMYSEKYRAYCDKMNQVEDDIITEIAANTLTKRYEAAKRLAETKRLYGGEFISFFPSDKSKEGNSFRIAGNLVEENGKNLNHYKIKADRTDDEEKALQYTAFNVTFNNIFSVDDPIVQKLANQNINLRDDLSRNGIYYQDTNIFNEEARNKYIQSENFLSAGLTTEEISSLSESLKNLPEEVKSNYEILSGNFDADQGSFEEIAKIYALGEIINNIRNYFKNNKDNPQLQNIVKGLELDENEPAKIEGDCLYLKGKIDGTVTNIKYDLRTGKLYMNSFLQKKDGEEKFIIGNSEPTTEIGNLNSFQDILYGYKSDSFVSISEDLSETSNTSQSEPTDLDKQDEKDHQTLKSLTENKLIEDLGHIGEIVKKRADKRGTKNSLINNFLRSFNILPDNGKFKTIDVEGGSSLYVLLESIRNTNESSVLNNFSDQMSRLMEACGFKRGSNIEYPENEVSFDVKDMPDTQKSMIVPLQDAINKFFKEGGEKSDIKNRKDYFNGSFNLSFSDIIVQNFCKKFGAGWELNIANMENYVRTVQDCKLDGMLYSIN